jgi:hypothetical protein
VTAGACGDHERDDDDADHGREPMAWHKRHGSAASGIRLDQPAG